MNRFIIQPILGDDGRPTLVKLATQQGDWVPAAEAIDLESRSERIEKAARALLEVHDSRQQHGYDDWLIACSQARRALRAALGVT